MSDQLSFLPSPKPIVIPTIAPTMRMSEREALRHFEDWWQNHVWLKRGYGDARKAYVKTVREGIATPKELAEGADRYAEYLRRSPTRYIKWPQGWLSSARWRDDLTGEDRGSAERARSSAHLDAARLFSGRAGLRG